MILKGVLQDIYLHDVDETCKMELKTFINT